MLIKNVIIPVIAMALLSARVSAQGTGSSGINGQIDTTDELLTFRLPPIEVLFENAANASTGKLYDIKTEIANRDLKSVQRSWMKYFSLFGTYQYGVMGVNSFMDLGSDYPIIYQNSGQSQIWYNFGGTIRIPFDEIFDRRNKIKKNKLLVEQNRAEKQEIHDEQKLKIVEIYVKAEEMINALKFTIEEATLADVQYKLAEKDYIMGTITSQSLSVSKGQYVKSILQLGTVKAELKIALMKLEILSNTKLLNKR